MSELEEDPPRLLWLMGFTNSAYGFGYAVVLVTVPQLLAAHGVAQPAIAGLTALSTGVSLCAFLLAPVLDTLVSRRMWAIGLAVLAAALATLALVLPVGSPWLAETLACAALSLSLYNSAIGGWLGAALPKSCDAAISTWFVVGNASGFGLGALTQFWLLSHLPGLLGPLVVGALTLAPLAIVPVIPPAGPDRKQVGESFNDLTRDLRRLVRQGPILRIILVFVLPCAAFSLTNAFGGLGTDFHAPDAVVSLANGVGGVVVGLAASLFARLLVRKFSAERTYIGVGVLGAFFTLAIVGLGFTPLTYVLAVLGENAAQSIAQVSQNAIIFRSIPRGSPLASSQFGLLGTAAVVPYAYMLAADGYGYKLYGGVPGSFFADAGLSLLACLLIAWPVMRWAAAGKLELRGDSLEEPEPGGA